MINKKYNRFEGKLDNIYIPHYGYDSNISTTYEGSIRCKLVHSESDSVVMPEQIYIITNDNKFNWIQPLTFFVNLLLKDENNIRCSFFVDISSGSTLKIEFTNSDWVRNFNDNSSLFKCRIHGPSNIHEYCTGSGYFHMNVPYLYLYHHTTRTNKSKILKSKEIYSSKWNIQGNKTLKNINYVYLTCLEKITKNADLKQIAMASDGKISLTKDNSCMPSIINPKELDKFKGEFIEINVYRENTYNRTATLEFVVCATFLSPKHLLKHFPEGSCVYYEINTPFIFRIGTRPGKSLFFENKEIFEQDNIFNINYQIIGHADTIEGLEAPFDEENTKYIFKIEQLDVDTNILDFWFEHANSDLFNEINICIQEFEK